MKECSKSIPRPLADPNFAKRDFVGRGLDIGGNPYYSAVMISNTGTDNRGWWWYLNVTPTTIGTLLNTNNARLYDLEKRDNGNWNCVMIRDNSSPAWYWWYDLTSSDILYLINNYGVRVIDIERYTLSGSTRYAIVTINNSNALTTSIGNAMRSRTNGQVGFWMERINGSNIANLNGDTQFEPASTMKTLHHTHAMRRVYLGTVNLSSLINVYTNYSSTNASCSRSRASTSERSFFLATTRSRAFLKEPFGFPRGSTSSRNRSSIRLMTTAAVSPSTTFPSSARSAV